MAFGKEQKDCWLELEHFKEHIISGDDNTKYFDKIKQYDIPYKYLIFWMARQCEDFSVNGPSVTMTELSVQLSDPEVKNQPPALGQARPWPGLEQMPNSIARREFATQISSLSPSAL